MKSFYFTSLKCLLLLSLMFWQNSCSDSQKPPLSAAAEASVSGEIKLLEPDANLQKEADSLLKLFDNMLPVAVYLVEKPVLKTGTNTDTGLAYTHCYDNERPLIVVKKSFYQSGNRKWLANALKHELTHAWLCRQGLMNTVGHGEKFRDKFKSVGGFGN